MLRNHTAILVAGATAGLITLSACSAGGYSTSAAPANQPQSVSQEVIPAGGVQLAVAEVSNLGKVVTDQNGLTLYRFDKDKAKPSASNCNDACAEMWPPALGDPASVQLQGVDPALVGEVTRADGTKQLTLSGWPLYTFAKDTAAGQANGQGAGKTWFAVTPQGKKAQAVSSSAPDAVSSKPDAGASKPDTGASKPDTGYSKPDTGYSKPDYDYGSGGY
jgi:predicted lipoprotein with Yx(FWY)xxD motif